MGGGFIVIVSYKDARIGLGCLGELSSPCYLP